jgi:tetratricopeptide (TPR) repeat protein
MRLFAAGMLSASEDAETAAEAHARFFNDFMRAGGQSWPTTPEPEWIADHLPAIHDLRAAIDWLFERPDLSDIALELTSRTLYLFVRSGLMADCRRYADTAIAQLTDTTPPGVAARLLRCSAWSLHFMDRPLSRARALQAAELAQEAGDPLERGFALANATRHAVFLGLYDEARSLVDEARQCMAQAQSGKLGGQVELAGGVLAMGLDDPIEARRCYLKALDHARSLSDRTLECFALINLAEAEFAGGDAKRAIEVARQALERPVSDDGGGYGWLRITFATFLSVAGDLRSAREAGVRALAVAREVGGHQLRYCMQQWTLLGAREGRAGDAAALQGFVDASYRAAGQKRQRAERMVYGATLAALREALGEDELDTVMAEGSSWRQDEALAFTLNRLVHVSPGGPQL